MYYINFDNDKAHELDYINDIYNIINPENIKVLNLSKTYIYHIDKDIFNTLTNLLELSISDTNLTNLDKDIFKNLTNLQKLDLDSNKFTNLDKDIFKNLTNLECLDLGCNKITNLDKDIFKILTNLQELNLECNKLTNLDKNIFLNLTNLQTLYLRYNKLTNLDKDIFNNLTNLQTLQLDCNQLTNLDQNIFKNLTNLTGLTLCNNKLTNLDKDIFKNLTNLDELHLRKNKLTNLNKDIFKNLTNLQILYLGNNNLTNIPSSIIQCRSLHKFKYNDNEIHYMPPNIHRFLNNLKQQTNTIQIYNDTQNVHNHHIQECIKSSLENILNYPKVINKDNLFKYLITDSKMTEKSIQLLLEYCQDQSIHTVLNITFEEVLLHVLEYIKLEIPNNIDNIIEILEIEILDSECKCFTGRISRLINCLNGFTPLVKVEIPDNMAISNIIIMIKKKYKGVKFSLQELKDITKQELLERGYDIDVITEYIEHIDI